MPERSFIAQGHHYFCYAGTYFSPELLTSSRTYALHIMCLCSITLKNKTKIMRAKLTLGLILCLTVLLTTSCHKYDKDDFLGMGKNDKITVCKDGNTKKVKLKHLSHWDKKGYVALIDNDGDGYVTLENSCGYPVDCDDDDADVNPDALEICDDEKDNNCNGLIDCEEEECASVCVNCSVAADVLAIFTAPEGEGLLLYQAGSPQGFPAVQLVRQEILEDGTTTNDAVGLLDFTELGGAGVVGLEGDNFILAIRGTYVDEDGNTLTFGGTQLNEFDFFPVTDEEAQVCLQNIADRAAELGVELTDL